MLRRLLVPSVILAVVTGLLAFAAPAHAAPTSPNLQIFVDTWNQSPTREYGTYVSVTGQTRGINLDGVPGSYVITRNGVPGGTGWSLHGSMAAGLMPEDPAGTYVIEISFTPDDLATYLPETKSVTIVRPKATTSLDLGSPATGVGAGTSWTLPASNPTTARLAVRAGSTAGACAVAGRRVDFTGAGTCTVDVTAPEDANHFAATPREVTFTVTQAPTTTRAVWDEQTVTITEEAHLQIELRNGADLVPGSAVVSMDGVPRPAISLPAGTGTFRMSFNRPGRYEVEVRATPSDPALAPSDTRAGIDVTLLPQSITAPPSPAYVGDTWSPTANGGVPVTTSSRTPAVCAGQNGQVTFLTPGTCQVDSSVGASQSYDAGDRYDSFAVVRVPVAVDATVVPLTANTQRVEVELTSVRGTPSGTVSLNGSVAKPLVGGRASWDTAGQVPGQSIPVEIAYTPTVGSKWASVTATEDLLIPKVPQAVTISAPPADPRIGETWTPTITFASTTMTTSWTASGACTRDGALVRFTATGDCTVSATQAGSSAYVEGTAERRFAVSRARQTFSANPSPAYVEDTWAPTASGGGPVTATSTTPAVCTATGGTVRFVSAGDCVVDLATGATGDADAAETRRTVAVSKVPVTLTVEVTMLSGSISRVGVHATSPRGTPMGTVSGYLDWFELNSVALTGGAVIRTYLDSLPIGESILGRFTYAPTAGSRWAQSTFDERVTIPRVAQAIAISAPPATPRSGQTWTPTITFAATSLATSWTASGACAREADLVRFTGVGDCTVSAQQAGNPTYAEGSAERTFAVARPLRTFSADPSPAYVDDTWSPITEEVVPVTVTVTTTAVCSTSGGTVTFRAAGSCVVDLSAPGSAAYDATTTRRTITVTKVPVTVTAMGIAGDDRSPVTVTLTSPRGTPTGTVDLRLDTGEEAAGLPLVDGSATIHAQGPTQALDYYNLQVFYQPDSGRWDSASVVSRHWFMGRQPVRIVAPTATARIGGTWTPAIAWHDSGQPSSWTVAGACAREDDLVRFTGVGDCTLTAVQSGSAVYLEGRDELVVPVLRALQPITFTNDAPTSAYVGGRWVPLASGGPSGRPVVVDAGPVGICHEVATAEGGVPTPAVEFRAAGECTVTFAQQGTADHEPGERVVTVPVALVPVELTLTADDDLAVGTEGTLEVAATADGEVVPGEVTVEGGGISVSGSVGDGPAELAATFDRAGTHELTVSFEPTDPATYAAAEDEVDVVVARGVQAITGPQPPETALVGDTWQPSYTGGGSGEPVAIEASGACERAGALVRFTAAGTCTLTVDQPGDDDWVAAPTVTATTEVGLVPVDVTVTAPDDARVGEATELAVVTSAPGTVEVVVDGQTLRGTGATLPVTFTKAGERDAEVSFTPADPATHQAYAGTTTLVVAKGAQQLALSEVAPATRRAGGTWTPAASGGESGSPVLVAAAPEAVCTAESGTVRFATAGDCEVTLTQAGSADYEPAPELRRTVSVERRTPSLTVTLPDDARVGEPARVTVHSDEEGSVRFQLDGDVVGDPVVVSEGTASATLLPTAAGERRVTATFTPDAPGAVAGGEREVTLDVARASTGTVVAVAADGLTATVSPTHAAAGVPTGEVVFAAGEVELGRADLAAGVATLDQPLDPDWAGEVTASYAGDADRAASTGSVRRTLPTIEASVRAARPAVRGWYDGPVVVEFSCEPGSAAPVTCPAPVAVGEGRAQSVTREVTAADGGRATVTVGDLSVDASRPEVAVRGVRAGAVVKGRPRATCRAADAGSGLASCRVVHRRDGRAWVAVATATDRVGHTAVTRVRYRQARVWVPFRPAGEVGTVTRGDRVWLVVLTGGARPVVTGPLGRSADVVRVRRVRGLTRWHVAVRFPADAERGASYRVRVRGGGTSEVVRFRVR
ncbi:MAG TPA: hypothetical protein VMF51_06110 [Nocardioides sp.]|uniref:hypothetical protein n=1 Tax=Nocardioides sp. TaxID=35761 RepID=UPI002C71754C|nr:hypothetical protein [Nocardioides sp.]HTW14683.1 hypothetical protein [Nocardioides sp.]